MSYKNAMADLPLGGGKAVIWGNSRTDKTPEMFRALGRAIESLEGRYWSAEDVGVSPTDMAYAAEETSYVAGLSKGKAASGDPSPVTAKGVFGGIKACAQRAFGSDDLNGRHVAVQGVGHVGGFLCEHLAKAGARLTITDVNPDTLNSVAKATGATVVEPDAIYDVGGGRLLAQRAGRDREPADASAAARRRSSPAAPTTSCPRPTWATGCKEKGVLYAPDYVINGGGIINVAAEISGAYDPAWVDAKVQRLVQTVGEVLDQAQKENRATNRVADELARKRISDWTGATLPFATG